MDTFFSLIPNPTRKDIDSFLNEPANKEVVENTMKELNSKHNILHPSEKYFMEQYKKRNTGGRRLSKKRPTARRRRSSKARKARSTRRR